MPWYVILALVCVVIAPFDALYMYIKASRKRDALRKEERKSERGERPSSEDRRPIMK